MCNKDEHVPALSMFRKWKMDGVCCLRWVWRKCAGNCYPSLACEGQGKCSNVAPQKNNVFAFNNFYLFVHSNTFWHETESPIKESYTCLISISMTSVRDIANQNCGIETYVYMSHGQK